jgi:hypothetical protein
MSRAQGKELVEFGAMAADMIMKCMISWNCCSSFLFILLIAVCQSYNAHVPYLKWQCRRFLKSSYIVAQTWS